MHEKNIIITGGTDGIGLALAKKLINSKNKIFIIGKNPDKGEKAISKLNSKNVEFFQCDLSEKEQIESLLGKFSSVNKIDILINNAGAIFLERETNSFNVEKTFALNHLAYFKMSVSLIDKLENSLNPKILNVSSDAHRFYSIDINDLENQKSYNSWKSYCRSKLLNIYFTYEFNRRLNTKIICNSLHPGFVNSNFGNNDSSYFRSVAKISKKIFGISTEKAAKRIVVLCENNFSNVTGKYFSKKQMISSSKISYDKKISSYIWDASLKYI
jgi:NAD(P)-dependent dehydrogenase (short-subunit alcohol dehydrogenase family)|tara:strand:+ start:43 stop:855 length:813 start_codon:yes stop_codon:yes gene_type:complete